MRTESKPPGADRHLDPVCAALDDEQVRARLCAQATSLLRRLPGGRRDELAGDLAQEAMARAVQNRGQYDLSSLYWRASGMLESIATLWGHLWEERSAEILELLRMVAFRYCNEADAWRHFCDWLKIDADAFMAGLPGYHTVLATERAARSMAYTPEEAETFLRKEGRQSARVPTADGPPASWRRSFDEMAAG